MGSPLFVHYGRCGHTERWGVAGVAVGSIIVAACVTGLVVVLGLARTRRFTALFCFVQSEPFVFLAPVVFLAIL